MIGVASARPSLAKTMLKSTRARMAWRAAPSREPDDDTSDGQGAVGCGCNHRVCIGMIHPIVHAKGTVDPWRPRGRRDAPDRSSVHRTAIADWHMLIACIVDRIEYEGRLDDFKVGPTASPTEYNAYSEGIVDVGCTDAVGEAQPQHKPCRGFITTTR